MSYEHIQKLFGLFACEMEDILAFHKQFGSHEIYDAEAVKDWFDNCAKPFWIS